MSESVTPGDSSSRASGQHRDDHTDASARVWRRLLWIGRVEGFTLLTLVGIAVPLKRLAGIPEVSRVLGPIHGIVFLLYMWAAIDAAAYPAASPGARRIPLWLLLGGAVLPFGTWLLDRRIAALVTSSDHAFERRTQP